MRLPIQYALLYPERLPNNFPHLDLSSTTALTFEPPDGEQFPCLNLALDASRKGGTYPAVLSTWVRSQVEHEFPVPPEGQTEAIEDADLRTLCRGADVLQLVRQEIVEIIRRRARVSLR